MDRFTAELIKKIVKLCLEYYISWSNSSLVYTFLSGANDLDGAHFPGCLN